MAPEIVSLRTGAPPGYESLPRVTEYTLTHYGLVKRENVVFATNNGLNQQARSLTPRLFANFYLGRT